MCNKVPHSRISSRLNTHSIVLTYNSNTALSELKENKSVLPYIPYWLLVGTLCPELGYGNQESRSCHFAKCSASAVPWGCPQSLAVLWELLRYQWNYWLARMSQWSWVRRQHWLHREGRAGRRCSRQRLLSFRGVEERPPRSLGFEIRKVELGSMEGKKK